PVVDMDDTDAAAPSQQPAAAKGPAAVAGTPLDTEKARLAALLAHGYTEKYPDVRKLQAQIAQDEAAVAVSKPEGTVAEAPAPETPPVPKPPRPKPSIPKNYVNPVLESQLRSVEEEIVKHKQELERLHKAVASHQAKLEAIPVREQEVAELVRD